MPEMKNERTQYRHRGYHCEACGVFQMVFGQDQEPVLCSCGTNADAPVKKWDHMVTQSVQVTDYVPPVA